MIGIFCPNFSNKQVKLEFDSLTALVGENAAYHLWNKYEGNYALALKEALALKPATSIAEETQQDLTLKRPTKPRHLNPEQHRQMSNMLSIMKDLFPEMSVEFVDYIEGGYAGEADLNAMKILIDAAKAGIDTIPHEYAHYYVDMFESSQIVQDGIAEFGSKEALVQAIGVKAAELDGKARTWWQRFKDFIRGLLKGKEYLRELIVAELTDSFLNRREIAPMSDVEGVYHQEVPGIEEANNILSRIANSVTFDPANHQYRDKASGKVLTSVTQYKGKMNYDTYNAAIEDSLQADISDEARSNGTTIHAILEGLLKGNLKPDNFKGRVSKDAILGLKKLVDRILQDYEFVASEAVLADAEHDIAGTADLVLRNRKTGKYTLMDFKTKLIEYNGMKNAQGVNVNKKGKKLNGFLWSTSKKFKLKSERDGYDFQLSAYKHMLNAYGIPTEDTGIIPIVYGVKSGTIVYAGLSKIFGRNEEDNNNLKNDGFYKVNQTQQTKFDVEYSLFKNKKALGEDTERVGAMIKDLGDVIKIIQGKLDIQHKVLQLKHRYQTQARDAADLLEKIQNMNELDALLQFVNYAADHLGKLNKLINELNKLGSDANWKLDVLQSYKEIASSYNMLDKITGLVHRYEDLFGQENVNTLVIALNQLRDAKDNILDTYDKRGSELYIQAIMPYVGVVRNRILKEERARYKEENPRAADEAEATFNKRVQEHMIKFEKESESMIKEKTAEFLDMQRKIADSGFECNSIRAHFSSVYESHDPFVQAIVKRFDLAMSEKDLRMIGFRSKLQRALTAFRDKYGFGNLSKLRDVYDDFVEITPDGKAYLINPYSSEFLAASNAMQAHIKEDATMTYQQKLDAWQAWLDENNPIVNPEHYEQELKDTLDVILVGLDDDKKKKIVENALKPANKRESWSKFYKDGTITADVRLDIYNTLKELDKKYRNPSRVIYKNEKYNRMLKLKASNDPKWLLYQVFYDAIVQYDNSLPASLRLNFRLPGIIKKGAERVAADGTVNAIKNHIKENSLVRGDDDIRGTFVDESGKRIRLIPLYYRPNSTITIDEQSFDLPTIFFKWFDAADTYLTKRDLESLILQTQAILQSRETYDNTISFLNKTGGGEKTHSHKTNTESQYDAWIDQVFYGNRVLDMGKFKIPFSDKYVDIAKFIKTLVQFQNKRVMSANAVAGLNNMLVAEINQLEESVAGDVIDNESYKKATQMFVAQIPDMLMDLNRVVPQNKINKLVEWFGIFEGGKNMSLTGFLRHGIDEVAYYTNSVGEREAQSRFLLAALIHMQAKDKDGNVLGSMLDFVDFDENNQLKVDDKVANFSQIQQNEFSLKVRKVAINMHGNYSERASVAAQPQWYGWVGLALRRWVEPFLDRRFRSRYYDELQNDEVDGMYGPFFRLAFQNKYALGFANLIREHMFHAEKLQTKAMTWNQLDDVDKKNIVRSTFELGVAALAYCLFALLTPPKNDDHDWGVELEWVLKYQAYRLYTDLTFALVPSSFTAILKDPFPVVTLAEDIFDLFSQLLDPFDEYQTGKHLFENKFLNKAVKLTPGAKQFGRMWNTSQEINSFLHQR